MLTRAKVLVSFCAGATGMAMLAVPASGGVDVWGDVTSAVTDAVVVGELAANTATAGPALSATGRFVVFESPIRLDAADNNSFNDVYRKDMLTGELVLVSRADQGPAAAGSAPSYGASISSDGSRVSFLSTADNLVASDTTTDVDVFVRDIEADATLHVSIGTGAPELDGPSPSAAISANGRFVAFTSAADDLLPGASVPRPGRAVYLRDLDASTTELVSVDRDGLPSDKVSTAATVSDDGRWVAFQSRDNHLVDNDTNPTAVDTFLRDMTKGHVQLLARLPNGGQPKTGSRQPVISADGDFAVFVSRSKSLVTGDHDGLDVFRYGLTSKRTIRISVNVFSGGIRSDSTDPSLSGDGSVVTFLSVQTSLPDREPQPDVWVRDVAAGITGRASVDNDGRATPSACWSASVSGNGRAVGFTVEDGTLADQPITAHDLNVYLRQDLRRS